MSSPQYQGPPSPRQVGFPVSRRVMLTGLAGTAGALAIPGLAACGSSKKTTTGGGSTAALSGTLTIGSNYSDPVPKKAFADTIAAFKAKNAGVTPTINTVDHNTFQEQINTYLQSKPDDVFTWFAGYRMKFFANQGLAGDISDVWGKLSGFADSFKKASTADDGKQYFVPLYYYPWAIFYRKSVFAAKGYQIPKTLDDLKKLGDQMKKDGLIPIAFADKDGWPAMGTFDYLNMRTNGYDFHISLMAGKQSWQDPKVKSVFDTWRSLLPYYSDGALGRTWQEGAQLLGQKKAGMYLLGSFVGQQFQGADYADLDFFPFPEINPTYGQDSVEAPIDGFMMAAKPKNEAAAKALLTYLGSPEAETTYLSSDTNDVAANDTADTSKYNALQKKAKEIVASAKSISQFLDRDSNPAFASTVMIPAIQTFLKSPTEVDSLLKNIQDQAKSIYNS